MLNVCIYHHTVGETLILLIQLRGEFEGTEFEEATLLTNEGDVIETHNLTSLSDGVYASTFVPPATSFQLQITGVDSSGNTVSRISTTGVQTSDVNLELGMIV